MSRTPIPHDELQDLSPEDAGDLRAFLEKRRWFEGKLKILESLPPIYPFVHPVLAQPDIHNSPDNAVSYQADQTSDRKLPTAEEIRQWQDERRALEEEVLTFDGGDLGRMKEKTRAVTLIPLTPPSTHLVSITLALIVLIDRLLTLLRQRSKLLELTTIRLQWDTMRWQIMQETAKVRSEIEDIARGKGKWIPPSTKGISNLRTPRRERTSTAGSVSESRKGGNTASTSDTSHSATIPSISSVSSSLSDLSVTQVTPTKLSSDLSHHHRRDSSMSVSSLRDTPKRSYHLPLLHSHIVNLEIRQRNLSSTMVVRSGKALDKMIDVAIPLKSLGGITGPSPKKEKEESGAVPDELLDIQDALELEVGDLNGQIGWCKQLEEQWRRADEHYMSSTKAQETGEQLLAAALAAITQPASSDQHKHLQSLLEIAQADLPGHVGRDFLRPVHPSSTDHTLHTDTMVDILTAARTDAEMVLSKAIDAIGWYKQLADASDKLMAQDLTIKELTRKLRGSNDAFTMQAPNLSAPVSLGPNTQLSDLSVPLAALREDRNILLDRNQHLSLASMQYRQVAKATPKAVRDCLVHKPPEDIVEEAETVSADALFVSKQTLEIIERTEMDAAILPLVLDVIKEWNDTTARLLAVQQKLSAVHQSEAQLLDIDKEIRDIELCHRERIAAPIQDVQDLLKRQGRSLPPLTEHLQTLSRKHSDAMSTLKRSHAYMRQLDLQSKVVHDIENETTGFLQTISRLKVEDESESRGTSSLPSDFAELEREIECWEHGLADRAVFISTESESRPTNGMLTSDALMSIPAPREVVALIPANTSSSAPPMTPPASPPLQMRTLSTGRTPEKHKGTRKELDDVARRRINEASSRVKTALAHLRAFVDGRDRSDSILRSDAEDALKPLDSASAVLADDVFGSISATRVPSARPTDKGNPVSIQELRTRLDDLHFDQIVYPSEDLLKTQPSSRQLPSSPVARRIRDILRITRQEIEPLGEPTMSLEHVNAREALRRAIVDVESGLPRLDSLVHLSMAVQQCDAQFSRLLDAVDESQLDDLSQRKTKTQAAVDEAHDAADPVHDDPRVVAEIKRIDIAWKELQALVEEALHPGKADETDSIDDSLSETSIASIASSITALPASRLPVPRSMSRITSNPLTRSHLPMIEPRNRATSDTPSRLRAPSLQSVSGLPRLRKQSTGPAPLLDSMSPPPFSPRTGPSSIPRPSRLSTSTAGLDTPTGSASVIMTPRARKSSRFPYTPRASQSRRKTYVSDPKSKLDVAVGKIINKLNVNVPFRPVGMDTDGGGGDDWKDQSGKYWIGAEGRAKLCFCRILRSKTVMVRVGGGWVELSKFLLDHFADSLGSWQPENGFGIGIGSSTPVPITSADHHLAKTTQDRAPPPLPLSTPAKGTGSMTRSSPGDLLTPQRAHRADTLSPGSSAGGGSPLVPLHFMRKASDSPEVREREKETLKAGRRSILGRQNSGL